MRLLPVCRFLLTDTVKGRKDDLSLECNNQG
jgi:hypothetical protein